MSIVDKNGHYLTFDYASLTDAMKVKAKQELHETEENVRDSIQKLRTLIKAKQVRIDTSDEFLIMFLRCKKYNIKKSFNQITDYSYQRHNLMKYYGFMFADEIMPVLHRNICGLLPKRDREGRIMGYLIARNFTGSGLKPDSVLKAIQVMGHFALTFPATQVCGFAMIADLKVDSLEVMHLAFDYIRWIIPTISAFPGRYQKVDCINTNIVMRTFANIMRPVVPSKLFSRLSLHGNDPTVLLKTYEACLLPQEFGGTLGPVKDASSVTWDKIEEFIPKLQSSNRFFKRPSTIPFPET